MLFSPPNEFGKQTFYTVVGYSCAVHVLLLVLIFGTELWLGMQPTVVSLRKSGRVSIPGSRRGRGLPKGAGSIGQETSQLVQAPSEQQPVVPSEKQLTESAHKGVEKKVKEVAQEQLKEQAPKNSQKSIPALPQKTEKKVDSKAKKSEKKVEATKKEPEKQKKDVKTESPAKTLKKDTPKQEKDAVPKKQPEPLQAVAVKETRAVSQEPISQKGSPYASQHAGNSLGGRYQGEGFEDGDGEEVCITEAELFEDSVQREFGRHFTIPEGFEEYDSFTISFDIKDGRVVNVSPHTKGALVVYTAVKDALLRSKMPVKNRKHVVWAIT